ncbi:MAG TPA: transglutaminase domain-containing protein, partial [Campylobacterales bacterium]|nr:transglutaminase domain-containing protein [Campylobacterales bacterium]
MSSKLSHTLSKVIIGGFALYFIYLFIQVLDVVDRRHLGTSEGTYVNSTSSDKELQRLAQEITQECSNDVCRVQKLLDYVTEIPYVVNHFTAHSPQETIQQNFGDCDDKSNLLISLLHSLHIESYFVLVPKHIFVIVALNKLPYTKALYLDGKPYYILESTAKNSSIGFPLKYELNEISAIVEPFENKKLQIE